MRYNHKYSNYVYTYVQFGVSIVIGSQTEKLKWQVTVNWL